VSVSAAYWVSEILSVGRCRSVSEAAERKSFVTGGHGWIVKGPAAEARYEPSGTIALSLGAMSAYVAMMTTAPTLLVASALSSALPPASLSSLYCGGAG